ncbi:DsbA family protein [Candidatus Gracilibacteria bacterium]|nr:DsbA family protein [Candidatus Gracilibacteria bacterium]
MEHSSTSNKNLPWMISTFLLLGIMIGFGVSQIPALQSMMGKQPAVTTPPTPEAQEPKLVSKKLSEADMAKLSDDDPSWGEANAPITMVEFSDFQCPYCSKYYDLVMPQITENYINTGKVRLIFRDFPLTELHPQAVTASHVADCALAQDKFQAMHDMLFAKQKEWSGNEKGMEVFQSFAKKLGMNVKDYDKCMEDQVYLDEIKNDLVFGVSAGVNSTPSFFINGKLVEGALPYENFFKLIFEAELAGKQWDVYEEAVTQRPYLVVEGQRVN